MVFIHLPVRSSLNLEKPNAFGFEQNDGMNKVTKVVMIFQIPLIPLLLSMYRMTKYDF